MRRDECRPSAECCKGCPERDIPFGGRGVESIVGGHLSRDFPDRLHRVEFRRVWREAVQLDAMSVFGEPLLARGRKVVTWGVVNDEEDLAPSVLADEALEERPKGIAVEHVSKPVREPRIVESYRCEQVRSLSLTVRVDSRLATDARPRPVKCAVEPEACFVFEQDYAPTLGCFFLIATNVVRSQCSCHSWSARASRFRGLCTENPSLCSKRGT